MALLPPLTQTYTVDAVAYLAGMDEMIARNGDLVGSIDSVNASIAQLSGAGDAAAAADARAGEAADAAAAATDRQIEAVDALAASMSSAVAAVDANTAALDEQAVAADRAAGANDTAGASAAGLGGKAKLGVIALAAGVAYAVVKAAEFQQQLTRLQTQAGLTGVNMGKLGDTVLKIGDETGQTGTAIAEALYHPISAGLNLATALGLVHNAAKLAAISGSDLDTTTYALSSVMKSYNLNARDATHTSALLNSIVGQGDMKFQDFVESVSNWAPSSAQMGISIHSMGAALAYLTDRGAQATSAATRLTMGLSMVTSPSKEAAEFLGALGLQSSNVALKNENLAQVMNSVGLTSSKVAGMLQKPDGIFVALTHIKDAFHHAGLSATQADAVMAKIFGGGRSDKAILALMQNLSGLKTKYEDIGKGVSKYGEDWKKTQETLSFQFHKVIASVENLAVSFGRTLIPAVTKVLTVVGRFFSYLESHPALAKMAGAFVAVAVAGAAVSAVIAGLVTAFDPITLIVAVVAGIAVGVYELWKHCKELHGAIVAVGVAMAVILAPGLALAAGLYELYKHVKAVRDAVADVGHFFAEEWQHALNGAGEVVHWFASGPLAFIKAQLAIFTAFWASHGQEIDRIAAVTWALIKGIIVTSWNVVWGFIKAGLVILEAVWKVAWAAIRDEVRTVWSLIGSIIHTDVQLITGIVSIGLDLLTGRWARAGDDLRHLTSEMFDDVRHIIATIVGGFGHLLWDAAVAMVHGFVNGIKSAIGAVRSAIADVGHSAVGALKSVLGIFSPSKVMYGLGIDTGTGLANGIYATKGQVEAAAAAVGQAAAAAMHQAVTSGTGSDMLRIGGSTGPATDLGSAMGAGMGAAWNRALAASLGGGGGGGGGLGGAARSGASSAATTLSDIGKQLGAALVKGLESSEIKVRDASRHLAYEVRRAFHDGLIDHRQFDSVSDYISRDTTRLEGLARKRAAVLKEIADARAYAKTVTASAQSFASLSNVVSALPSGTAETGGALLAGLQGDLSKIRQFNDAIKRLAKLGLDRRLLRQIINAGPVDGLAMAQAILAGPISQIQALNRTESQITQASRSLGQQAAGDMYNSGKNAGKGFYKGLEDQQKHIEELMRRIAKTMVRTIRQELGISSPSKVARWHGQMFAEGLADGVDDGSGKVAAAALRLSNAAGMGGGGALGGGHTQVTNHFDIKVEVPGGFVGSNAQLSAALAVAVQKAILQQQGRNPTPQTSLPSSR